VRAIVTALDQLTDEALLAHARAAGAAAGEALGLLYQRHYSRVAGWCLRFCDGRLEAADLAQEVFLRVHERLDSFRGDSRFSTWLYTVARSVALNRAISARRRQTDSLDEEDAAEPVAKEPGIYDVLERAQAAGALRQAMRELEPLEAKVMSLHFVHGMTLPAITALLGLENKSGAKAYVVSGGRRLKRILLPGGAASPRQPRQGELRS
jgi:RNA polymerase sigma-70 factor (ECF subfamily)